MVWLVHCISIPESIARREFLFPSQQSHPPYACGAFASSGQNPSCLPLARGGARGGGGRRRRRRRRRCGRPVGHPVSPRCRRGRRRPGALRRHVCAAAGAADGAAATAADAADAPAPAVAAAAVSRVCACGRCTCGGGGGGGGGGAAGPGPAAWTAGLADIMGDDWDVVGADEDDHEAAAAESPCVVAALPLVAAVSSRSEWPGAPATSDADLSRGDGERAQGEEHVGVNDPSVGVGDGADDQDEERHGSYDSQ
ncbi:hypothetical protein BU14_0121s0017 [Porphyra umbilicalis]|uniref:Uncharacterized protein n=1 Tax=Porphyra umbilicalis TaxID=2786 RepID=A0A1X6PB12_PORUM|nr:hypothetical protein BU14_0121s0017 [Porphyra umbilicalis]|eukprot:OSX78089.1 hypothetical protein BU14_0121s0017 [Porphyra umbilicalis]